MPDSTNTITVNERSLLVAPFGTGHLEAGLIRWLREPSGNGVTAWLQLLDLLRLGGPDSDDFRECWFTWLAMLHDEGIALPSGSVAALERTGVDGFDFSSRANTDPAIAASVARSKKKPE